MFYQHWVEIIWLFKNGLCKRQKGFYVFRTIVALFWNNLFPELLHGALTMNYTMIQPTALLRRVWLFTSGNHNQMGYIKVMLCKRTGKELPDNQLFVSGNILPFP